MLKVDARLTRLARHLGAAAPPVKLSVPPARVGGMCGRYVSARSAAQLRALFDAADETGGGLRADFNVAPTKDVPAVIATRDPTEGSDEPGEVRRELRLFR